MELAHTIALISGGASGLGAAAARGLVAQGARVLIFDQNELRAETLAGSLGQYARWMVGDVTEPANVQAAIDYARQTFGGLNAVINTAGISTALRTTSKNGPHPLDVFEEVVRINLTGSFNVLRLCATAMVSNPPDANGERGVLINVLDTAAFDGQAGQAAYAASKGGLAALTLPVSRDLAGEGIRVIGLVPPAAETPGAARHNRGEEFARMVAYALITPGLTGENLRDLPPD